MDIRTLTEADLPALLDLCERALPFDSFNLPLLRRRVFEDPEFEPSYQLAAWQGERLAGALLGVRRTREEGPIGALNLFAVDAPYRRQGVATQLFSAIEERMRAAGCAKLCVGGVGPNFFWPGLDLRYTPAFCLLEKQGYQYRDGMVNMQVELALHDWSTAEQEARLASEGFELRRLEHADREPFAAWMLQSWNKVWHDETLDCYKNEPISAHVALKDGQFCAFAGYHNEAFAGAFGPTGTLEALRGKGLGRLLFYRCMEDMHAQGLQHCEVQWVGPISFYARIADAWINRTFWSFEKLL